MITITIYQNQDFEYSGFRCIGHAEFAEPGSDIICAGVSSLVINTINSIDAFTDSEFTIDSEQESGLIELVFKKKPDSDAILLIKSLVLGLQGIQKDYGDEYVVLRFKEV